MQSTYMQGNENPPFESCSAPQSCNTDVLPDYTDENDCALEIPAVLLCAPENERQMIAWTCEAYRVLQTQRAVEEEKFRQLFLKAREHRRIADAKGAKAKLIKQHFDMLVQLAMQGMNNSKTHHKLLELDPKLLLCSNSEYYASGSQRQENIKME